MGLSFANIVLGGGLVYAIYMSYTMYHLFNFPDCHDKCIQSSLAVTDKSDLALVLGLFDRKSEKVTNIFTSELNFDFDKEQDISVNVSFQKHDFRRSQSIVAFIGNRKYLSNIQHSDTTVHDLAEQTMMREPTLEAINLLGEDKKKSQPKHVPVLHWRKTITILYCNEEKDVDADNFNAAFFHYAKYHHGYYLNPLLIDRLSYRVSDTEVLLDKDEIEKGNMKKNLTIKYRPVTLGKMKFHMMFGISMDQMKTFGLKEADLDDVKGIFTGTNIWLLCITLLVAIFHLTFEFLSFKNDVSFWRQRKTCVGVSQRTIIFRFVSEIIVFLYLMDSDASRLVVFPLFISGIIELWKLFRLNGLRRNATGSQLEYEQKTESIDKQAMKYLVMVLMPLCIGGAVYSLIYVPHRTFYSWTITTLANCAYAFGFIFMLPQLFINYRLKSVSHLPWRAFTYKAFNTFIDDVFAFIVTMPTSHRLACFRDDIVFFIYLYQRYLYPVDYSRPTEYAAAGDDKEKTE